MLGKHGPTLRAVEAVQAIPARPGLADHGLAPDAVAVPALFEVSVSDPVIR
jgi:hypothetical protein